MTGAFLSLILQTATISIVAGPDNIRLNEPFAVAFDRDGNWYILEHKGERIVRAGKDGKFSPFAGTGQPGRSGDHGPALQAQFFDPHGLVATRDGRPVHVQSQRQHHNGGSNQRWTRS